ncbi:hypothetical protein, partial [Stenotrophomonas sp.]|uniref:hypothetical protein n=1 Tax=Stenotrophomonas sp. TaxID=69392 RepID=UPI0028AB4B84
LRAVQRGDLCHQVRQLIHVVSICHDNLRFQRNIVGVLPRNLPELATYRCTSTLHGNFKSLNRRKEATATLRAEHRYPVTP